MVWVIGKTNTKNAFFSLEIIPYFYLLLLYYNLYFFRYSSCKNRSTSGATVTKFGWYSRTNERNRFIYGSVWKHVKRFSAKAHYFTDFDQHVIKIKTVNKFCFILDIYFSVASMVCFNTRKNTWYNNIPTYTYTKEIISVCYMYVNS